MRSIRTLSIRTLNRSELKCDRSGQELDLGAVSNQWVAEHRLGQTHDTQR